MCTIALSSPLGPRWTPGHWGSTDSVGIRAHHAAGLSIVEVGALPDTAADLRTALNAAFSITLAAADSQYHQWGREGSPQRSVRIAAQCGASSTACRFDSA